MTETKICSKCKNEFPADLDHFYRRPERRQGNGLTSSCKRCHIDDRRPRVDRWVKVNRKRHNANVIKYHKKYPDKEAARQKTYYSRHPTKMRNKEWARSRNGIKTPDGRRFTMDYWNALLEAQGHRCAICGTTEPGKQGWQIDHCHKTKIARFILCGDCNRGLGGFKDSPALMRKAADMLEQFYTGGTGLSVGGPATQIHPTPGA